MSQKTKEALQNVEFLDIGDDEIVSDAMLILRVTNMKTGTTSLVTRKSVGTDSIIACGLLNGALEVSSTLWEEVDDEEGDDE